MRSGETPEQAIVRLYKDDHKKPTQIKVLIGCGYDRVDNTLKYFNEHHKVPDPKKMGRPTKATHEVLSKIDKMTTENRAISGFAISQNFLQNNFKLSPSSVNNYRKKILNYNYKMPKIRQNLTEQQINSRYLFSNSVLDKKIDLNKIIFSDESRFCLSNDGQMIWIKKGENCDDIFIEKCKFNPGIMVYGAIGKNYKSKLVICQKNVDDIEYRRLIIESKMIDDLKEEFYFMQDGAPAHKSANTTLFFKKKMFIYKILAF